MAQQSKKGMNRYYGLLRIVLVLLIIGRVIGIVSLIAEFNKPVDVEIIAILNDRAYKIGSMIGTILELMLFIVFYKIISV